MNSRPRLLFLAYYFPPFPAVGCVRAWNIAKYLARSGWDVTVVTPQPSLWGLRSAGERIAAELGREGIRSILTGHRWLDLVNGSSFTNHGLRWFLGGVCRRATRFLEIDPVVGWLSEAAGACSRLGPNDVDLILATGSPFCAFGLARRLAKRLDRPYVLDYRDPWTDNPHAARPARAARVREEARLLADCAAVTVVSESWAAALEARFHPGQKLHVVTNGFDPEDLSAVQPQRFDHFAIVYTGRFYPPKRVIHPVMAALQRLKGISHQMPVAWRFHYYGGDEAHVLDAARQYDVLDRVVVHGRVARSEALSAVGGAGVAVVITSVGDEGNVADQGIVTGKLFEPLGLGTPVLLIAPAGSDTERIIQLTGLARRLSGSDIAGLVTFLKEAMLGRVPGARQPELYSWPRIAQGLDLVLRQAAGNRVQAQARQSALT